MADAAVLAHVVVTSFVQGIKALKVASTNLDEAPSNLTKLKRLVEHLDEALAKAERKYSNKLHNDEFRVKLEQLGEMVEEFKLQVQSAEKVATKRGMQRLLTCCWSAAVGDELLSIAFSMETQLHSWTEQQNVPASIDEALENYAEGLPSYLTLQPEDGYQPLVSKIDTVSQLLQSSPHKFVLLHGLSGIGKSSLAHFVAANCLPRIFADGSTKLLLGYGCSRKAVGNNTVEYQKIFAEKIVHLLRGQLGYKRHEIDGISLKEAFILLEETLKGKSYLIIVDDVWEPDVVVRFMKLQGNSCKYLVTSRLYGIINADVDRVELTKDDVVPVGKDILQHHSQVPSLPAVADVLLERCGFHPLTITVIGQALEGEVRQEQWIQAIKEIHIYASRASVPNTNLVEDDVSYAATVFGSLEFSLNAMEKENRDLFTTLAALSWVEPIPEACLEVIWRALRLQGTFKMAIASLLKGSLIGKHKLSYSYFIHDMVALYLDGKLQDGLKLLKLPSASDEFDVVLPWLLRYGKEKTKEEASSALVKIFRSRNEVLQASMFEETINVCSACRNYQDWANTSKTFVLLIGPEIPRLIADLSASGSSAQPVVRFITNVYSDKDWEYYLSSFIDSGILAHLRSLLKSNDELDDESNDESLKSMIHLVKKLATFLSTVESPQETLDIIPMEELVRLLDPASKVTRNFVAGNVMKALTAIAKAGGQSAVDRMFAAGLGEMLAEHIRSDFEEFSGSGMRELYLLREHYLEGGSLILDTFLQSRFLERLPGDQRTYFQISMFLV